VRRAVSDPGDYVTFTTTDFVTRCSPAIREIFEYWNTKRGERKMPQRADIDPAEFKRHLPRIMLVDVSWDPLDFVYRLTGTDEVRWRHADPTGKRVEENYFGPTPELVMKNYRYVAQNGSFLYDPNPFVTPDNRYIRDETIMMPLCDDHGRVSQILVYAHYTSSGPEESHILARG
jgi:hypothetical protein